MTSGALRESPARYRFTPGFNDLPRYPSDPRSVTVARKVLPSTRDNGVALFIDHMAGCEPKLWDQAAAFDDASGWLRLAGADGLSASAAQ